MAGFFGFFDYTKPGKGVRKDEPKRSHAAMFFVLLQRKFWKIIQVNLLFILFSIPIVTIGPSVAAMTYILRNFANEQPVFLFSDFWDAFKNNFKQSFLYSILFAVVTVLLYVSGTFYFHNASANTWMYIPLVLVLFIALLFIFANFYIYLMIVTLDLPLKAIIKNGFLLAILCIKSNLFTLVIGGILVFLLWLFPVIGFLVYLVIGFAFLGFLIIHNSYRGIKKYAIDPYMASLEEEAGSDGEEEEKVFSDEQLIPEDKKEK